MGNTKRFETIHSQPGMAKSFEVIVDLETGVHYLLAKSGYGGGITPLLDKDGKVMITPLNDNI